MNLSRLLGATMVAGALGPGGASAAPVAAGAATESAARAVSAANVPATHVPDSRSGPGATAGLAMPPAGAVGQ
jgi:hypothetical protein